MRKSSHSSLDALFPKTRQVVLTACLLNPEKWWYLSDLAKHLSVTPSSLQRELASLVKIDLLSSRKDGNRVYYRANEAWSGIKELQSLLIKTAGMADVIRSILKKFMPDIDLAFIFGSVARSEQLSTSDIDIMIVGDVKLSDIVDSLRKAEKMLEREINPVIFNRSEFNKKIKSHDAFVKTVIRDQKIFLKGSEHDFKEVA